MEYKIKKDEEILVYDVIYNNENLEKIQNELKKLKFISFETKKINICMYKNKYILKNYLFNDILKQLKRKRFDYPLEIDEKSLRISSDKNYIEYDCFVSKYPKLYYLIDLLLYYNERMYIICPIKYEFDCIDSIIDGISLYKESFEYKNIDHNLNRNYDFNLLDEIYKKLLNSINFKLVRKEIMCESNEILNIKSLKKTL